MFGIPKSIFIITAMIFLFAPYGCSGETVREHLKLHKGTAKYQKSKKIEGINDFIEEKKGNSILNLTDKEFGIIALSIKDAVEKLDESSEAGLTKDEKNELIRELREFEVKSNKVSELNEEETLEKFGLFTLRLMVLEALGKEDTEFGKQNAISEIEKIERIANESIDRDVSEKHKDERNAVRQILINTEKSKNRILKKVMPKD